MEKFAINKKMLRKLTLMNNHREPSLEIIDSLFAQIVLELSIFQFQKAKLQTEIDTALKTGDKNLFTTLAQQYNEILHKYKDGIHVSAQGFEYTMEIDE
ncbi:MAG: IDEAL domain-containing protein [Anaerobacillus sp.]|uniref:IDEAL domain-containing protein n=1 Tax=Anaerobacillus sp. TaxID=1872506 RepID=UPI0039197665